MYASFHGLRRLESWQYETPATAGSRVMPALDCMQACAAVQDMHPDLEARESPLGV